MLATQPIFGRGGVDCFGICELVLEIGNGKKEQGLYIDSFPLEAKLQSNGGER